MDSATAQVGGVRSFHGMRMTKVATIPIRTEHARRPVGPAVGERLRQRLKGGSMRSIRQISTTAIVVLAALALLAGTAHARGGRPATTRPNVVVIMTDDQDFRSMGVMPK